MADRWFVTRDGGAEYGPYTRQKLKDLADRGRLVRADRVRPEDEAEWSPAGSLAWLFPPESPLLTEFDEEPARPRDRRPARYDPDEDDEDDPRGRRRRPADGAGKTLGPAIGLYVTGLLALAYGLFNLGMLTVTNFPGAQAPPGADEGQRVGHMIGYYGAVFGLPVLPIPVLIGAFCLHTYRAYPLALMGCILATIPCCSPLLVLGMPFGIWGLVALTDKGVKRAFNARG